LIARYLVRCDKQFFSGAVETDEANDLAADIRREADTLYKTWLATSERVRDWQQKLAITTKVGILVSFIHNTSFHFFDQELISFKIVVVD